MPDGTVVHNDKMIFWVPVPWDGRGGRVSLAGDACHPLPPRKPPLFFFSSVSKWKLTKVDRGQGLNHSILDALNFVEAVKKIEAGGSKEKEMAGYDEEAIRRGAEEVKLSVNTTHTIHNWAEFMESPLMKYGVTKMS
jgi:2-polyprenyl-6-methoxyphenol hydroxylase-like FAD-dependent oxidoreductase